jgi:hypothetical protein
MELWKNRSGHAHCCICHQSIEYKEPCIKVETLYFPHGSRSCYMHIKCIDKAIEELKEIRKQASLEVFVWKLKT